MNGYCKRTDCHRYEPDIPCDYDNCDEPKVHKPEPNESPSSPRTRGSLPASQADSAFEGTGTQLAPVLCPPDPPRYDKPSGDPEGCLSVDCDDCEDRKLCDDHTE